MSRTKGLTDSDPELARVSRDSIDAPGVGDTIADKYRLVRRIGEGGMGTVFEARHLLIGKRVAIKILHTDPDQDSKGAARFMMEARAAAATGHKSIIDVHDIGKTDSGQVFLVMEYLVGEDLHHLLGNAGPLDVTLSAYIVAQVLSALHSVHSLGIIHRDLKPANIYLAKTGQTLPDVKLLDFGVSKMTAPGTSDDRLTTTGAVMGTVSYMAPEQAKGAQHIDHRVDIYAAGVILYEALTGTLPYYAENTLALIYEIIHGDLPEPSSLDPNLPPSMDKVILRAMARSPDDRYESAEEMFEVLMPFLDERTREHVSPPGSAPTRDSVPDVTLSELDETAGSNEQESPELRTEDHKSVDIEEAETEDARSDSDESGPKHHQSRWVLGALAVIIAVVVGGLAYRALTNEPTEVDDETLEASTTTSPEEEVTVTLVGVPEDAEVYLDGERVDDNELKATRTESMREIRVQLAGRQVWRRNLPFDTNRHILVELLPEQPQTDGGAEPASEEASPPVRPAKAIRGKARGVSNPLRPPRTKKRDGQKTGGSKTSPFMRTFE